MWHHSDGSVAGIEPDLVDHMLPDYLNDLNAMFKAERTLSLDKRTQYLGRLNMICEAAHRMAPILWLMVNAEASQRAEAFLKTLGLWKD